MEELEWEMVEGTALLVTCQIMQYKVWKLSDYTARGKVKGQEMLLCTRGAGKRVNSYSTCYQFKDKKKSMCSCDSEERVFSSLFLKFPQVLR